MNIHLPNLARRLLENENWSNLTLYQIVSIIHRLRITVTLTTVNKAPDDVDPTYFDKEHAFSSGDGPDPEFEDESDARWHCPPVHFVYDAVAERTRQRLEGRGEPIDNRVH